ncbi:MAG TPA: class I SAM-dependent methyltransferase [Ktedonobacterales bacterium]|nr:class I SAM-dependent methyltransferase [Ktedonobacterales bacterium]
MPTPKTTLTLGKNIVKNLALGNPLIAARYQRRARQENDPEKAEASYPLTVFHRHVTALEPLRGNLAGADVLEIGPGGNVGFALLALLAGAHSAACLDVAPLQQRETPELYATLVKTAATFPDTYLVDPALLERARQDPDALARELLARVTYHAPMDLARNSLPDASLDVICSHTCFEHFADPTGAAIQIARLLRPGGVTSHQIDLRDHRDFDHPLEFLAYSETLWRLSTSHMPNAVRTRWRASQYRAAFEKQGLEVVYQEVVHQITVTEQMRRRFARRFRKLSLEDLGILSLLLVARKRNQPLGQGSD